jgi:hypothetical protein
MRIQLITVFLSVLLGTCFSLVSHLPPMPESDIEIARLFCYAYLVPPWWRPPIDWDEQNDLESRLLYCRQKMNEERLKQQPVIGKTESEVLQEWGGRVLQLDDGKRVWRNETHSFIFVGGKCTEVYEMAFWY